MVRLKEARLEVEFEDFNRRSKGSFKFRLPGDLLDNLMIDDRVFKKLTEFEFRADQMSHVI